MSEKTPTASSSSSDSESESNLDTIFKESLEEFKKSVEEYKDKTKVNLPTHPLVTELEKGDKSPAEILKLLLTQVEKSKQSTSGHIKSTKWLKPIVHVLCVFSSTIGAGAGLVFRPANVIFAGAGVLLSVVIVLDLPYSDHSDAKPIQTAKDVLGSLDAIMEILECIENFFRRLEVYANSEVPTTKAIKYVITKIMVAVLGIFAILTKEIKQGKPMRFLKNFLKRLIGRADIEGSLKKLDRLTNEEFKMAVAQTLKEVLHIQRGVEGANKKLDELHRKFDEGRAADEERKAREDEDEKRRKIQEKIEEKRNRVRADRAWLSPPNPSINHNIKYNNIINSNGRMPTWLIEGGTFLEWESKPNSSLWIQGKVGSGKSVLCSAVIEHIMGLHKARQATLAYFYFDFNEDNKTNLDNALPSLLTQLATRSDRYCDILSDVYDNRGGSTPGTVEMIRCLDEMLEQPDQGPVYIILDALDECSNTNEIPSARTRVLDFLNHLVDSQPKVSNLHLCVTSRPEDDIRTALKAFRTISIQEEKGQKDDIDRYIKDTVYYANSNTLMGRWNGETKNRAVNVLTEKADGMFRWVYCQLVVLQGCRQDKVKQTLNKLPKDLDETYARILKDIAQTPSSDDVIRLLQCIAVAIRPLRVEELAEVLALDFDGPEGAPPELKDDDTPLKDRQRDVLSICSSLILLFGNDDSGVVQFSHFSVLEFLTSDRLSNDISQFHVTKELAHTTIAQACLGTLLLDGSSVFKGYASRHWLEHAQFGTVSSRIQVGMQNLFDSAEPYFAAWLKLHDIDGRWHDFGDYEATDRGSPLYYASLCGFRDLAAHIIVNHPEQVHAKGGRNHSPLAAALYKRHFDVAKLLHKGGATLEVSGHLNRTPLHTASVGSLVDVTEWLLDHEAKVDSQDDKGWTPINLATEKGHVEIVQKILGHKKVRSIGVCIDAANGEGNTPLHVATNRGHVKIVKLLLSHGANVHAQDKACLATPLHQALSIGRFEVARLLLDYHVDVEIQNRDGRTPLHLASLKEDAGIVRLLLDRGAKADAKDKDGRTPLFLAWTIEMVGLLLDCSVSANVKNKEGTTLTQMAPRMGKSEIVRALKEHLSRVDGNEQ